MPIVNIAVTKGGKGASVAVDTDSIPQEVYAEALALGLKTLVNRGTSKVTGTTYPDKAEREAKAMEIAAEQVEKINTGKIKFSGANKPKKASGAVMTEARRLARNLVKDEMKRQKIKVSHVDASEITKAANELLDDPEVGPELINQATANVAEREAPASATSIVSKIKINDKKVAKAEAEKAERKTQLSAKQAGKTKTRAKAEATA